MYRIKVTELDTGKEILVWEEYSKDDKDFNYYLDIECTQKLDKSKYQEVEEEDTRMPFQLFGIECGKGWFPLIKPIIEYIDHYNEEHVDEPIHILQIKEKWGELCIHLSHGTRELFDMINAAEEESTNVCEFCGTRKDIGHTQGWIMTVCRDCIRKMSKERNLGSYRWYSNGDDKTYWVRPDETFEEICNGEEDLP